MTTKSTVTSIMFEEIKELLECLNKKLDDAGGKQISEGYTFYDVETIIKSIKVVDVKGLEDELNSLNDAINNSTKEILNKLFQITQQNQVVQHKHTIDLKSVKTVLFIFILSCLLCLSLFFNLR